MSRKSRQLARNDARWSTEKERPRLQGTGAARMGAEMDPMAENSDDDKALIPASVGALDIGSIDPAPAFRVAEQIVQLAAKKCQGPKFIALIGGKNYPKVEWWSTVGASLGLFPREESSIRLDRENEIVYEAIVGVYRGEKLVARASAICSSTESRWRKAEEYAVKSMATTRATGKAYRIGLAFLAVMAGLEPTSAEEIPPGGFKDRDRDRNAHDAIDGPFERGMAKPIPYAHDAVWDDDKAPLPEPDLPDDLAKAPELSPMKAALQDELAEFSPKQRDGLIRRYSQVMMDGKPVEGKFVESLAKMLSPTVSDKWAGVTLGRIREARKAKAGEV